MLLESSFLRFPKSLEGEAAKWSKALLVSENKQWFSFISLFQCSAFEPSAIAPPSIYEARLLRTIDI